MDVTTEHAETDRRRFLEPLILTPEGKHQQTFIVLHGRGSTAQKFAQPLLKHAVSRTGDNGLSSEPGPARSFQQCFPGTKWVFPTASLQRAVIYKRSLTQQWFDNWSLDRPEHRQDLQIPGLQESSRYIHSLLQDAIMEVGASNVVLIGLSQGCAASLTALLLWQGPPIKAFVGMCGWLPFRVALQQVSEDILDGQVGNKPDDDIFDHAVNESEHIWSKLHMMRQWLVEELEWHEKLAGEGLTVEKTPILLAHGTEDEKVPHELGRLASSLLDDAGLNVSFRSYEGLAHWYSASMLQDVVDFLQT